MSITCEDLMSLKHFQSIKLLAGHSGIHRTVTWPYIVTTPSVAEWLNSGELLFVIYGKDHQPQAKWELLQNIIIDCSKKRISGLVLVESISSHGTIPSRILELADDYSTPLYVMPWDLKLLNVTKEIINLIISEQNIQKKREIFMERLLFSACETEEELHDFSTLHSISLKNRHFIFILTFTQILLNENNASAQETLTIVKTIMALNGSRFPIILLPYGNDIIGLCSVDDSELQLTNALAFGSSYPSLREMSTSFKEAKSALYFVSRINPEDRIAHFDKLTLYRLFFDIHDHIPTSADIFVDRNLKLLMEYDEKNGAELVHTLKFYLQNNGNLIKTADALYIHRNTLIYRLNLIKRTLNNNLDSSLTRISLFLSILYYEFTS